MKKIIVILLLLIPFFGNTNNVTNPNDSTCADEIDTVLTYANAQLGQPYVWAGCRPGGFDCSGFVAYCFKQVDIPIVRSSSGLDKAGTSIDIKEARKGDLILFTGTNPKDKSVGHVGIVISEYGEPIRFIHASSSELHPGVVITDYENSGYPKRFAGIRRIFECE